MAALFAARGLHDLPLFFLVATAAITVCLLVIFLSFAFVYLFRFLKLNHHCKHTQHSRYDRLMLAMYEGSQDLFVGTAGLMESWRLWDPLLQQAGAGDTAQPFVCVHDSSLSEQCSTGTYVFCPFYCHEQICLFSLPPAEKLSLAALTRPSGCTSMPCVHARVRAWRCSKASGGREYRFQQSEVHQ
jgi:hypothetical protein